jgi:LiaI-LiaF-like transmembrane region
MKCANHPQTDSIAYCAQCGKALCAECRRDVTGTTYCESCLAARLHSPLTTHELGSSPGVALALGFIPGVGAIYNGQVIKAMVQVLIFGSLIGLSNRVGGPFGTIFGLGAFAWYCYMVIDSYQTARAKQLGKPAEEWFGLGDAKMNAPLGASLLIGLGVLFLLDNFGVPVFSSIGKFWPVLLIVLGIFMFQRKVSGGSKDSEPNPGSRGPDQPQL